MSVVWISHSSSSEELVMSPVIKVETKIFFVYGKHHFWPSNSEAQQYTVNLSNAEDFLLMPPPLTSCSGWGFLSFHSFSPSFTNLSSLVYINQLLPRLWSYIQCLTTEENWLSLSREHSNTKSSSARSETLYPLPQPPQTRAGIFVWFELAQVLRILTQSSWVHVCI